MQTTARARYGKYRKITEGINDDWHKAPFEPRFSYPILNNSRLGHKADQIHVYASKLEVILTEDTADRLALQLVLRLAGPTEWEELSLSEIAEKSKPKLYTVYAVQT